MPLKQKENHAKMPLNRKEIGEKMPLNQKDGFCGMPFCAAVKLHGHFFITFLLEGESGHGSAGR
jgi:hypothetical protein